MKWVSWIQVVSLTSNHCFFHYDERVQGQFHVFILLLFGGGTTGSAEGLFLALCFRDQSWGCWGAGELSRTRVQCKRSNLCALSCPQGSLSYFSARKIIRVSGELEQDGKQAKLCGLSREGSTGLVQMLKLLRTHLPSSQCRRQGTEWAMHRLYWKWSAMLSAVKTKKATG